MRVLFTTPLIGIPPVGGPELRIANSLKALASLVELDVFPRVEASAATRSFLNQTCRRVLEDASPGAMASGSGSFYRSARSVGNRLAPSVVAELERTINAHQLTRRHTQLILDHAKSYRIGVVWFGYGCISYRLMRSVRDAAPDLQIVCDTDSIWSQFISRELNHELSQVRRKAILKQTRMKVAEEKRWVDFCDVTTAVCDVDAEYYRKLAKDPSRIKLFRNAIDVSMYDAVAPSPPGHHRPNLLMAGSYYSQESPMVRAARWTVAEVVPRLTRQVPGLHLYLVGKGSELFVKDLASESVTVTGRVDSILPYLKNTDVALAPLPFEAAGTKFKVLEAAICGVPIVASPVGAEGFPRDYSKYLSICVSADEFVSAILAILRNTGVERTPRLDEFRARVAAEFGLSQLAQDATAILRAIEH